ncbi:acetyl-CoA C-acetyltransferase [Onchocerca flexuosa]|uniref:Acetyl-CoA C-acetyltransferase n=1 Tax=Onchocerca flexuosa TaxID=387005 RepID=A0A238BIN0_9BILA|nr:acetyl-CoA C-acetyltransferase [Onchocerca flexuosa]
MVENTSSKNGAVYQLEDVYIISAVRTPIGGYRKMLKSCSPVYLGTIATKEAIRRAGISPSNIDETMVGCVLTSCHGQNIARQISINAGIPVTSPSVTINKVCSSSMKAIIMAIQAVHLGDRDVVLAAGTESMSNAYYGVPRGDNNDMNSPFVDSMFEDGLSDAFTKLKMGVCAEKTCSEYSISRKEQDEYALESYRRAHDAWKEGLFTEEVIPVKCFDSNELFQDEEYKKLDPLKVPILKPAFIPDTGTITAANASSISDGAAALLIASGSFINRQSCQPIALVLGYAEAALEPVEFSRAPSVAVKKLLSKIGLSVEEISLWEVNEAFAATAIVFLRDMGLDSSRVNVRGGAVALGHPIGASGARIVVTLLHALKVNQIGIATICNGGGESTAVAVKRL